MDFPTTSSEIQSGTSGESAFGFPEKDVIHFINSNGLSRDEARDFMLFLTFVHQTKEADNDCMSTAINATVLADLVTHLNCATKNEEVSHEVHPSAPYPNSSENEPLVISPDANQSLPYVKSAGYRPPLAKHNDVKFYPNIICVICKEWVCSRSRRLHIGAHFDYRKYRCSSCDYSHSKEIFVASHIRRYHNEQGVVVQHDDLVTEDRIEIICNESIAMTRDVLSGCYDWKTYADYSNLITPRNQITNRERSNRTKILTAVADATNRQHFL